MLQLRDSCLVGSELFFLVRVAQRQRWARYGVAMHVGIEAKFINVGEKRGHGEIVLLGKRVILVVMTLSTLHG